MASSKARDAKLQKTNDGIKTWRNLIDLLLVEAAGQGLLTQQQGVCTYLNGLAGKT